MQDWQVTNINVNRLASAHVQVIVNAGIAEVQGTYSLTYDIFGDGNIVVTFSGKANGEDLGEMPRFGMQTALPKGFETLQWFGPGPQETYWDRKDAKVGLYQGTVSEQYFDYSQPQESGNKENVRWATLSNGQGVGLLIQGMPLLAVNVLHYSVEDLTSEDDTGPAHIYEVQARAETYLNLDWHQMGVGGDNSWGARTHEEFVIDGNQGCSYRFCLRPYTTADISDIRTMARQTPPVSN
jgi:beta-galactosidase